VTSRVDSAAAAARTCWSVAVIATPTAATWMDLDVLTTATGCLTRTYALPPRRQNSLPRAEVAIAAPMTFNSINKWASGFSDTLALGVLNEMLGADVPILAVPCVKPVLHRHPAYRESVTRMASAGVSMMDSDAVTTRADDGLATLEWQQILFALKDLAKWPVEPSRAGGPCSAGQIWFWWCSNTRRAVAILGPFVAGERMSRSSGVVTRSVRLPDHAGFKRGGVGWFRRAW
jgi:flavoprotein